MQLGAFSVSLAVSDLDLSEAFYNKLGFSRIGGDPEANYLILQNDTTTIGLFQGMFDKNIMTFNPGWDESCETLDSFMDVRDLQRNLEEVGLEMSVRADPDGAGPASFVIEDPDGNPILIDQHV
jgi:lactoylglutathione lyase